MRAIDAIVRVSFQSSVKANQAVNLVLVGHRQNPIGPRPFKRVNTAAFACRAGDPSQVVAALNELGKLVLEHADRLDFLSVTVVRRELPDVPSGPPA